MHRDIKPDNIMLHEGVPLVTDFGIALATDPASRERLTKTGLSVGTPSHMSPEQAVGERIVRPSSDVYAQACVLYEMLAGAPPFTAPNATALIARIISERPTKLRAVRNTVPVAVEAAVDKALSKLPADRYQRATEFADALSASARDASSVSRAASVMRAVIIGLSLIAAAVLPWVTFGRSTPSRVADTSPPASGTSVAARASYVKPSDDPHRRYDALSHDGRRIGDARSAAYAEMFRLPFRVTFNIWDPNLAALRDTPRFRDVILPRVKLRGAVARLAPSPAPVR